MKPVISRANAHNLTTMKLNSGRMIEGKGHTKDPEGQITVP